MEDDGKKMITTLQHIDTLMSSHEENDVALIVKDIEELEFFVEDINNANGLIAFLSFHKQCFVLFVSLMWLWLLCVFCCFRQIC